MSIKKIDIFVLFEGEVVGKSEVDEDSGISGFEIEPSDLKYLPNLPVYEGVTHVDIRSAYPDGDVAEVVFRNQIMSIFDS